MKLKCDPKAVASALVVLNEALTQDRRAIQSLLEKREVCNSKLIENDTIQVREGENGAVMVSALGLLNGILGTLPDGSGPIAAVYDNSGLLVEFIRRG